jgi:hypothetical protein
MEDAALLSSAETALAAIAAEIRRRQREGIDIVGDGGVCATAILPHLATAATQLSDGARARGGVQAHTVLDAVRHALVHSEAPGRVSAVLLCGADSREAGLVADVEAEYLRCRRRRAMEDIVRTCGAPGAFASAPYDRDYDLSDTPRVRERGANTLVYLLANCIKCDSGAAAKLLVPVPANAVSALLDPLNAPVVFQEMLAHLRPEGIVRITLLRDALTTTAQDDDATEVVPRVFTLPATDALIAGLFPLA